MKSAAETIQELGKHKSPTPSRWRENAEWRQANKGWLRYSQHIAMMMLDRMEQLGMTQRGLADRMGCSQQYVSKLLKGTENLSIETLSKIEAALSVTIFHEALS